MLLCDTCNIAQKMCYHQGAKMDRFVDGALPSKGKMECNRLAKPAYLKMATTHAIRLDLDNPAIDRAITEPYQAIYNQDIASDASYKVSKLSLPKGGKSKGARLKQRQTFGVIINGATKSFLQGKATPTRYGAESIANAVKNCVTNAFPDTLKW
jgi:hypothetical protein